MRRHYERNDIQATTSPGFGGNSLAYDDGPSGVLPWRVSDDREAQIAALMLTPLVLTLMAWESWLTMMGARR